jgi:prevent-host-death family protein
MRAVTIKEAKARLNELVDAAQRGEQIVLMRGAKHVATLVPITDADLEISTTLTDAQAARLWGELAREAREGRTATFESPEQAVLHLSDSGVGSRKVRKKARRR